MPTRPSTSLPPGFSTDFSGREAACVGIFGSPGSGKSHLCVTATEWAAERDKVPGWIVCDRKTRKTVREVSEELGLPLPLIHDEDFIPPQEALRIASLDRDKDTAEITRIYENVRKRLLAAAVVLGSQRNVEPIILETGTQIWDWISFSHFGKKQDVGKSRVWGPPKQDWSDLLDGLSHKTTIVTLWDRDEYKDDKRTGFTRPDGPPHIGFSTTTLVRMTQDRVRKLKEDETYVDRFGLDIYESQDNKGLESQTNVLTGESITFGNLMALLRPGE